MKKDRIQAQMILLNSENSLDYNDFISKEHTKIKFIDKIENKFNNIRENGSHMNLKDEGKDFIIYIHGSRYLRTWIEVDIYGEEGLLKIVEIAKENKWQIFSKNMNMIIDLNFPEKFKYEEYREKYRK